MASSSLARADSVGLDAGSALARQGRGGGALGSLEARPRNSPPDGEEAAGDHDHHLDDVLRVEDALVGRAERDRHSSTATAPSTAVARASALTAVMSGPRTRSGMRTALSSTTR